MFPPSNDLKGVSAQKMGMRVFTKPVHRGQLALSSFIAYDKAALESPLPAPVCMPRLFVSLNAEPIHLRAHNRTQ